ncbi:homogentisate 1,2-dioxygenase [Streptomyces sp. me109]|nr:homogentisate 1,2-dioxygenase [Streptomyces sp. me109]
MPGRAGGEAFALHADSALGDYLGAVGLTRASSDLRDFQVMASVNFDHRDPSLLTALTSTTSTPGLNNIDFCAVPPE